MKQHTISAIVIVIAASLLSAVAYKVGHSDGGEQESVIQALVAVRNAHSQLIMLESTPNPALKQQVTFVMLQAVAHLRDARTDTCVGIELQEDIDAGLAPIALYLAKAGIEPASDPDNAAAFLAEQYGSAE